MGAKDDKYPHKVLVAKPKTKAHLGDLERDVRTTKTYLNETGW